MNLSFFHCVLLASATSLLLACPTEKDERETPESPHISMTPDSPNAPAPVEAPTVSPPQAPREPGWDDPPATAWTYSGSEHNAGLTVHHRGAPLNNARAVLVFFHGYGAEGDDLVDLSQVIEAGPGAAFLFPEAPVALKRGGRAWFRRDRSNFSAGVERAKLFLSSVVRQYPNRPLIVGGFSQGAMLTANLLESGLPLRAAIIWSPADLLLQPLTGRGSGTPVFLSHGDLDRILPFSGALQLGEMLTQAGYTLTWVPFRGPHTIPRAVLTDLNTFLSTVAF
jgi:phospholipase/carboxylesterase